MAVAGVAAAMDRFFQYRDLEECCILKENVSTGGNGYVEYVEWNLMSPVLFKTYTSFENELATNGVGVLLINIYHWMQNNPWFPVFALGIYGALIVAGKKYFKDRNPWKLRKTLALWNFSLSLFSLCGVFRLLPQVLYFTTHLPLKESVCGDVEFYYGRGSSGLWVQLFVLSKFP